MRQTGKFEAKKSPSSMKGYFASLLSLMVCCAMFLSTTFAWLSYDVVSRGNEIHAGSLQVSLLHHTDSGTVPVNASYQVFDTAVKWQPDDTQIETLTVANTGELAFSYGLQLIPDEANCVFTGGLTLADVARWFEVYRYAGTPANATDDLTDTAWVQITDENGNAVTLAEIFADGLSVVSGELNETGAAETFVIGLHLRKDADPSLKGQKLCLDVKLTATQKIADSGESSMEVISVTPENLALVDFTKDNTLYRFNGSFDSLSIQSARGLNQVFDGNSAAVAGEMKVSVPGVAGSYSELSATRAGTVTVTGFHAQTLNVLAYGNEQVNVTDNTVNAISVIGGNFALKLQGNQIDGNFGSYPDGEGVSNQYGISLRICDYTLTVTDNTIVNTYSHAFGLNGRQGEGAEQWLESGTNNRIEAFSGNRITVNSTEKSGRAAVKIWCDKVYAPYATGGNTPNGAAQALMQTVLSAQADNVFHLTGDHSIFNVFDFVTNDGVNAVS